MKTEKYTQIFEITTSPSVMKRLERFLALLHFNSGFGHSGTFAMALDGDGQENVQVKGIDNNLSYEVDAIGGVGYDVEIARDNSYSGVFTNKDKESKWYTGQAANLYKDGDLAKTIPNCDWSHKKNGSHED